MASDGQCRVLKMVKMDTRLVIVPVVKPSDEKPQDDKTQDDEPHDANFQDGKSVCESTPDDQPQNNMPHVCCFF